MVHHNSLFILLLLLYHHCYFNQHQIGWDNIFKLPHVLIEPDLSDWLIFRVKKCAWEECPQFYTDLLERRELLEKKCLGVVILFNFQVGRHFQRVAILLIVRINTFSGQIIFLLFLPAYHKKFPVNFQMTCLLDKKTY